jgi:hypothetical protein
VNDALGLINYNLPYKTFADLSEENRHIFWGVEYSFIPLFSLMGERVDDTTNIGVRFSPSLGLTVDYDLLDVEKKNNLDNRKVLNIKYKFGF